jgi:hypothetical protein
MKRLAAAATLTLAVSAPAWAQTPKPLPLLAFDVRGFMTSVGDGQTANDLHVTLANLPSKVYGFAAAANLYLKRGPGLGIGLGGELIDGRGRRTRADANDATVEIKTATRLMGFAGNATLNFGSRDGWSYLNFGYGPLRLWSYLDDGSTLPAPAWSGTMNFGGGARWFFSSHIAFHFDVRFYFTTPEPATEIFPGRGRKKLTLLSAGISFR